MLASSTKGRFCLQKKETARKEGFDCKKTAASATDEDV
jgi:hypothetical protein